MAANRFASLGAPGPAATDEPATDLVLFDPVPLRYRADGLTPAKQREYVEALADTGLAREAAARIGVSEQAIARARRRADARSFDLACDAAIRHGARRLRSIAFERAIEGTIKQHFYHGELKGEERVYDNRLLVWLLGKVDRLIDPAGAVRHVGGRWESLMDEVEHGPPPPPEEQAFDGSEVWEQDGEWRTDFPPPPEFRGFENGQWGQLDYYRTLSEAEQAVIEADAAARRARSRAKAAARRDLYFGFADADGEGEVFSPLEAETSETSGRGAADDEPAGGSGACAPVAEGSFRSLHGTGGPPGSRAR